MIPLHKRISRPLKRLLKTIGNTAGGDNPAGEAIHGILDWLPVPNQPLGKLIKAILSGNLSEAKEEVGKLLTIRNSIALVLSIPVLLGWVTIEEIKQGFEVFSQIQEFIGQFTG